ncbi:MAG: hypothetical protein CFE45_12890 [Burkholderiales bacterium PBB5]|nr:MAG: hypothetical protein CFE45_12890 [Burkholderiales bacterium PBB5]
MPPAAPVLIPSRPVLSWQAKAWPALDQALLSLTLDQRADQSASLRLVFDLAGVAQAMASRPGRRSRAAAPDGWSALNLGDALTLGTDSRASGRLFAGVVTAVGGEWPADAPPRLVVLAQAASAPDLAAAAAVKPLALGLGSELLSCAVQMDANGVTGQALAGATPGLLQPGGRVALTGLGPRFSGVQPVAAVQRLFDGAAGWRTNITLGNPAPAMPARQELVAAELVLRADQLVIEASQVKVNTGSMRTSGVFQCDTMIAVNVIATTYTPGAGNIS